MYHVPLDHGVSRALEVGCHDRACAIPLFRRQMQVRQGLLEHACDDPSHLFCEAYFALLDPQVQTGGGKSCQTVTFLVVHLAHHLHPWRGEMIKRVLAIQDRLTSIGLYLQLQELNSTICSGEFINQRLGRIGCHTGSESSLEILRFGKGCFADSAWFVASVSSALAPAWMGSALAGVLVAGVSVSKLDAAVCSSDTLVPRL